MALNARQDVAERDSQRNLDVSAGWSIRAMFSGDHGATEVSQRRRAADYIMERDAERAACHHSANSTEGT